MLRHAALQCHPLACKAALTVDGLRRRTYIRQKHDAGQGGGNSTGGAVSAVVVETVFPSYAAPAAAMRAVKTVKPLHAVMLRWHTVPARHVCRQHTDNAASRRMQVVCQWPVMTSQERHSTTHNLYVRSLPCFNKHWSMGCQCNTVPGQPLLGTRSHSTTTAHPPSNVCAWKKSVALPRFARISAVLGLISWELGQ